MGEIIDEYGGSLGILIMGCGILKIFQQALCILGRMA